MSNFKKGDEVTVTKPGTFNGLKGKIVSLKAEVDFGSGLGSWAFDFDFLTPGSKPINSVDEFKQIVSDNLDEFKKVAKKPVKSDKPKRSLTRRDNHK